MSPTGYTAAIYDAAKENTEPPTFAEFALASARAIGYFVTLRDDAPGPIPERMEQHSYYEARVTEAKAELERLERMPDADAQIAADGEYQAAVSRMRNAKEVAQRYRDYHAKMVAEAQAWTPPTDDHQTLKKFMLDQLNLVSDELQYLPNPPTHLTGAEWKAKKRTRLEADIQYYTNEVEKEKERVDRANAYAAALRQSLGLDTPAAA